MSKELRLAVGAHGNGRGLWSQEGKVGRGEISTKVVHATYCGYGDFIKKSNRKIRDGAIWLERCGTKVIESSVSAGRRRRAWSELLVRIDGAASWEATATNATRHKEI